MPNKRFLFFFVFSIGFITSVCAQESTLWLRNGKKVAISAYEIDNSNYYEGKIFYTTLKGKVKDKYLEDVFSVLDFNGKEDILYEPNQEYGEVLTALQMKQYVLGIGDARLAPISKGVFIGGVAFGMAGAFIPPLQLSMGASTMALPLGILAPVTYIGVVGATGPDMDKLIDKYPLKADNEHYIMGYQEGVKKKRLKKSILGSCIGFVSGIIIYSTIN